MHQSAKDGSKRKGFLNKRPLKPLIYMQYFLWWCNLSFKSQRGFFLFAWNIFGGQFWRKQSIIWTNKSKHSCSLHFIFICCKMLFAVWAAGTKWCQTEGAAGRFCRRLSPSSGQTRQLFSCFCVKLDLSYRFILFFCFCFYNQRYFCVVAWSKTSIRGLIPSEGKTYSIYSVEVLFKGVLTPVPSTIKHWVIFMEAKKGL